MGLRLRIDTEADLSVPGAALINEQGKVVAKGELEVDWNAESFPQAPGHPEVKVSLPVRFVGLAHDRQVKTT